MANEERYGQSWNDEELDLIVADYFSMLRLELDGEPYSKSEFRRALVKQIGRTEGSIERKHQNISAVLLELEMRTIDGYKPLSQLSGLDSRCRGPIFRSEPTKPDTAAERQRHPRSAELVR